MSNESKTHTTKVKKVVVKIGHSIDTLPPYRNSEQNYKRTAAKKLCNSMLFDKACIN